ncbi:MAG: carboxylesterase type B [Bacteroidia bacterium]|jgi:carboxylesterase type B
MGCRVEAVTHIFRIPSIRLVQSQSINQPDTWMYLFVWPSTVMDGFFGAPFNSVLPAL